MDDMISRRAAIDALCHIDEYNAKSVSAIKALPSAQPECEDAVSRFEVLRLIDYSSNDLNDSVDNWYFQGKVKELPSVTPKQPGWIPCSKKLPELNRSVLVQLSDDFVDPIQIMTLNISKCEGDFFYFWETQEMGINFEMGDVVAWVPLPKPAKIEV